MHSSVYGYLTIFHAIVAEGSIAGAARKLEMAPPSVSQALKLLERHIGLPLFNRTTRKMELTEAGQRLFDSTKTALQQLDFAFESVHDLTGIPTETVRMTIPHIAYWLIIRPHLGEFVNRFPGIQLEISINDGTVDILKEGFDLGIRFGDKIEENVVAKKLPDPFRVGLFASKDYTRRHGLPKRIEELFATQIHRLSLYYLKPPVSADFKPKRAGYYIDMPYALITNNLEVVMDGIRQGIGIGRVFEPIQRLQPDSDDFVPVLEKHWKRFPPLNLFYMQHSRKAARVRAVIDFLTEKTG